MKKSRNNDSAPRGMEAHLQSLFVDAPIPIWEEDYSRVKRRLDELRQDGIVDFEKYFDTNPGELKRLAGLVRVLNVNKAARRSAGLPDDLENPSLLEVFSAETFPVFRNQVMKMLAGETSYSGESITTAGEGGPKYYVYQWTVVPGYEADYSRVIVSAIDITTTKRTEAALKQSEFKFATAFRFSPDALIISSLANGHFIDVNDSFLDIFGYRREEVIGNPFLAVNMWEEPREREELNALLRKEGGVKDFRTRFRTQNGDPVVVSLSCEPIMLEKEPCLLTIARDVTQLEEARRALMESAEKYRTLVEAATEGIFIIQDGLVCFANSRLEAISGYSIEEITGRSFLDFVDPEERDAVEAFHMKRARGEEVPSRYETRAIVKSGRCVAVEISVTDFQYLGRPALLVFLSDISERHRAEERMREWNRELERNVRLRTAQFEEANRDLESFAHSISHDLRAPLRHIDGFARLMRSNLGELDEKTAHYFERILQASTRMHGMIDDLLEYSRIGRRELNKTPVDLEAMVAQIVGEMKPETGKPEVDWRIGSLGMVMGDPGLLHMVFENLLGNAVKFTATEKAPRVEISRIAREDGNVCIRITDNGVGFDPQYTHKLFEVFQRLHREEDFPGSGIGLANVKRILERHGGRVSASGREGEGAEFTLILPGEETNNEGASEDPAG